MLKALGFRGNPSPSPAPKEGSLESTLAILDDAVSLENGMRAMDLVMDDLPKEAEQALEDGIETTYSKLARGVIHFIEATLSFEAEDIQRATTSLYEAEQSSQRDRAKAQKLGTQTSSFSPGVEYAITLAESHLLGAITLFLSESMVDSVKALYKLRKAYLVLDEVNRTINGSLKAAQSRNQSTSSLNSSNKGGTSTPLSASSVSTKTEDERIVKRAKQIHLLRVKRQQKSHNLWMETLAETAESRFGASESGKCAGRETVDEFIRSGVDALFGLLQLVISIIPPGFGKVLSIIGFHGDREEGLNMMWDATQYCNIHGSVALLALLQYYDGPTQFSDIALPDDGESNGSVSSDEGGTDSEEKLSPAQEFAKIKRQLDHALAQARKHYSRGALWQLQEGRMVASKGDLRKAVEIMDDDSNGPINMKQVEGLMLFDKTIMIVILHGFEQASKNFVKLIDLNSWSHAFYAYMSASCQLEIYRQSLVKGDEKEAEKAKEFATEWFNKIPSLIKKRGFMAKQMPFDVFSLRKLNQWKELAVKNNVDLVDAIGTSPIHEVIYFWGGYSKMPASDLESSLQDLGYSGEEGTPFGKGLGKVPEHSDEQLTRCLLQSVVLRALARHEEGVDLLEKHVLPKVWTAHPKGGAMKSGLPKMQYIKGHRDPYAGPSAIYERGIFEWQMRGVEAKATVVDYMDLASHWADDYELSTRVGMRIKSATDRLELMP